MLQPLNQLIILLSVVIRSNRISAQEFTSDSRALQVRDPSPFGLLVECLPIPGGPLFHPVFHPRSTRRPGPAAIGILSFFPWLRLAACQPWSLATIVGIVGQGWVMGAVFRPAFRFGAAQFSSRALHSPEPTPFSSAGWHLPGLRM
jgi:hypothetical protein